jgi:hypothetical protein
MEASVPNLTRRGVIDLARDLGMPVSKSWLDKQAMIGQGPKPLGRIGQRHVYAREDVLKWLKGLIKPIHQKEEAR